MAKLIILSIVFVSFGVPIWLSGRARARPALRQTQGIIFFCILIWAYLCLHWYPALVQVE